MQIQLARPDKFTLVSHEVANIMPNYFKFYCKAKTSYLHACIITLLAIGSPQ